LRRAADPDERRHRLLPRHPARRVHRLNLAAFLTRRDIGGYWPDIEAATQDGAAARTTSSAPCSPRAARFAQTDFHFRTMNTAIDVREAVEVDACDAFIMSSRSMSIGSRSSAVPARLHIDGRTRHGAGRGDAGAA